VASLLAVEDVGRVGTKNSSPLLEYHLAPKWKHHRLDMCEEAREGLTCLPFSSSQIDSSIMGVLYSRVTYTSRSSHSFV
jgi:hypothetical protein